MSQLYQITDTDLSILEQELPRLMSAALETCKDPLTRKRWEEVKRITSDVRWGYGPPTEVTTIPADETED